MNKEEFEELKRNFAKETKRRKINKLLKFITTLLSIIGIVVISYYFIDSLILTSQKDNNQKYIEFDHLKKENVSLKQQIKVLELDLKNQSHNAWINIDTNYYRLTEMENRIKSLEQTLIVSPEKALTIPLLSQEIKNQEINNTVKIESLKDKITTITDLNKWVLGLIFSLLITIVVSNLYSLNQKKDKNK